MTIGERIYAARRAAGLSQRQLAGETITRNMLSLLEHDQANPSLETLRYLSAQLGRPVSYFLGEDGVCAPAAAALKRAREAYAAGDLRRALELTEQVPEEESVRAERELIWAEATLAQARKLLRAGAADAAERILAGTEDRMSRCPYCAGALMARRSILAAEAARTDRDRAEAVQKLPSVDEILLLRACSALQAGDGQRAGQLLDAAGDRESDRWQILRGDAYAAEGVWEAALECYRRAEPTSPLLVRGAIQNCYAKLGNFEQAYRYATME